MSRNGAPRSRRVDRRRSSSIRSPRPKRTAELRGGAPQRVRSRRRTAGVPREHRLRSGEDGHGARPDLRRRALVQAWVGGTSQKPISEAKRAALRRAFVPELRAFFALERKLRDAAVAARGLAAALDLVVRTPAFIVGRGGNAEHANTVGRAELERAPVRRDAEERRRGARVREPIARCDSRAEVTRDRRAGHPGALARRPSRRARRSTRLAVARQRLAAHRASARRPRRDLPRRRQQNDRAGARVRRSDGRGARDGDLSKSRRRRPRRADREGPRRLVRREAG